MSPQQLKDFIKQAMQDVVVSPDYDESVMRKYMSEKHQQHVHGRVYDFEEFLQHTKKSKQDIRVERVDYIELLAEDNKVCAHYDVHAVRKADGGSLVARIMVIFYVEDGKIFRCHELSHILVGDESDRDITYRQ